LCLVALIGGGLVGFVARKTYAEKKVKSAEERAKSILEEADKKAQDKKKEIELESKELLHNIRADFEKETKERRAELVNMEKRLIQREENLDKKVELLDRKEKELNEKLRDITAKEQKLHSMEEEYKVLVAEEKDRLQRVSGLTAEEAKKLLLARMEEDVKQEAGVMIKRIEDETRQESDKKAREILATAIQRCAVEHTVESTVSVVNLPSDEMKGRIIGREGRNIRALEMATGVDVIIDDTPEAVILSGFDPVKREIARIALTKLMEDGRIHPGRIEEIVEKVKKEMEVSIKEAGEHAVFELGIRNLHPELVKLIGKLKYRTSYGQNVLDHLKESAFIMGTMANELGLDANLAKRIGLLHDIGKAVSHEVEGAHPKLGAEMAKKYGENEIVVNAIEGHHGEIPAISIYTVLSSAADAVSGARPGARRETLEIYIKRLEKLEEIADSFKGVEKAYAIQAGREIRVIVEPAKITDAQATVLAREIKKKIEEGMEYPGQIKITVIRETRAIEYAK
ncbi:MAG: ribonuclease Y, partial [Candidatus Omnitrophica bacterium]|nr:ribonuclease Y [Candidatus Omnitrophota bacterium]